MKPVRKEEIIKNNVYYLSGKDWMLLLTIMIYGSFLLNLILFGPPPLIVKLFKISSPYDYINYGKFKGFLLSLIYSTNLIYLIVIKNKKIKTTLICINLSILLIYILRGPAITAVMNIIIFIYISRKPSKKDVFYIFLTFISIIIINGIIGSIRSGDSGFLYAMQIKDSFKELPISILWFITYTSAPLVNTVNLFLHINDYNIALGAQSICGISSSLCTFLNFSKYHLPALVNPNNNVYTYLGPPSIDFGWAGVLLINIFYALVGTVLYIKTLYNNNYLYRACYSFVLTSILELLFFPMLITAVTVLVPSIILYIIYKLNPSIFEKTSYE